MTDTSLATTLPFEILSRIFVLAKESLYRTYLLDLKSCALVCSHWRSAAQRSMFYAVSITYDTPLEFYSAVIHDHQHAHLAEYIKSLKFQFSAHSAHWVTVSFPSFLRRLSVLKEIVFIGESGEAFFHPHNFNPDMRNAFLHAFSLPTFNTLVARRISGYQFPLALLLRCAPNLEHLTFDWNSASESLGIDNTGQDFGITGGHKDLKLRTLEIGGTSDQVYKVAHHILRNPSYGDSCSTLRSLILGFRGYPEHEDSCFMLASCSALEELTIAIRSGPGEYGSGEIEFKIKSIDIGGLRSLRSLRVVYSDHHSIRSSLPGNRLLEWIVPFLRCLPCPEKLESINIPAGFPLDKNWLELDQFLANRFQNLSQMMIVVSSSKWRLNAGEFPQLSTRGVSIRSFSAK